MNSNLYDPEDNGSGYADEFIPGQKRPYKALSNVDDISDSYKEMTGTDSDGYGDDDEYDDDYDWE